MCDVSISWGYVLLSTNDNFSFGKWAKIERNDCKVLRVWHQQSNEEYTCDTSELVNQDVRIVWASLISSLEVAKYNCLPHHFFNQPPLFRVKIIKKSFSTYVWTCNFLKLFPFLLLLFHVCPLAGNTRRLLEILSIIWFGNLCCNFL